MQLILCLFVQQVEKLNSTERATRELRVYPCKNADLRFVSLEAVEEPVLHFSLDKHNRDAGISESRMPSMFHSVFCQDTL